MIAETEMKNLVARKATVMLKCKRRKIPDKFSLAPMVGTIQWMEAHDFQVEGGVGGAGVEVSACLTFPTQSTLLVKALSVAADSITKGFREQNE